MYRDLNALPVLAKEGAIVPLSQNDRTNDWSNPEKLTVRIFRGTNSFTLYEDDGETMNFENGAFAETVLSVREAGEDLLFTIGAARGDLSVLPARREWKLVFDDISSAREITVRVCGSDRPVLPEYKGGKTSITIADVSPDADIEVVCRAFGVRKNPGRKEAVGALLSKYQLPTLYKQAVFNPFMKDLTKPFPLHDSALKGPVEEILMG